MASKAGRKAKPDAQDTTQDASALESKRVLDLAFDQGVLSRSRRIAGTSLPPTKLMAKADGKDIVKRSSARRNRHLLVFNCQLAPAAAGRLGTLARLDTKNPVMYVDFPQGRLKLLGTLVFPRNKYVVLRLGAKEVVCEDVLESMIVFGQSAWVGSAEDNPEERELPMPAELARAGPHTNYSFDQRGGGQGGGAAAAKEAGGGEEEEEEEEEEEDNAGGANEAVQEAARKPARRASRVQRGGKRQRYAEDSDASFGEGSDEGGGDFDAGPAERKLPRLGGSQQPSTGGGPRRRAATASQPESQPESHPIIDLAGTSSEEDEPLAKRPGKQRSQGAAAEPAAARRPQQGKKAAPKPRARKAEEEAIDLAYSGSSDEDADEGGDGTQVPASQRPRRAAGAAASKKLRVSSGSESSASEGGTSADSGDGGDSGSMGADDGCGSAEGEEESEEESEG